MNRSKAPLWYIQKKGRTEGPIPEETIAHAINKGELGPLDLVFREGDNRWQVLSETAAFADLFAKKRALAADEDQWVVLVKDKNSKARRQNGPFKTSQIKAMLKAGQLQMTDYVWKEGMKEWYRLHSLDVFHREDSPEPAVPVPEVPASREALLKSVKVMERPKPRPPDPIPPEASTYDLTKTNTRIVAEEPKSSKTPAQAAARPARSRKKRELDDITQVTQTRRLTRFDRFVDTVRGYSLPRKTIYRFAGAGAVALLMLGLLYFMTYHDWRTYWRGQKHRPKVARLESPPPPSEPVVPVAPKLADTPAGEEKKTAPPAPEKVTNPTFLKLRLHQPKTAEARLDILTDASRHFSVKLRIIGETGRVIGRKSFYREMKLTGLEARRVEFDRLNLPMGYYQLEAEIGDFAEKTSLGWRVSDKNFRSEFSAHRKDIAPAATMERYYLIKTAEHLHEKASEIVDRATKDGGKNFGGFYKKWSQSVATSPGNYLKSVTNSSRNNYVYAAEWMELKDLQKDLIRAGRTLNAAKDKTAAEATTTIRQMALDLARRKEAALQASLWR